MRRLARCCRKAVPASSRRLLQFKASKREISLGEFSPQLRIALFHALEAWLRVARIKQGQHDVFHDKPPFVVMNRAA